MFVVNFLFDLVFFSESGFEIKNKNNFFLSDFDFLFVGFYHCKIFL